MQNILINVWKRNYFYQITIPILIFFNDHFQFLCNCPTVMYKKSAVLRAGNYQDAPLMEDDLLWVCMIQTGANLNNLINTNFLTCTGTNATSTCTKTVFQKSQSLIYPVSKILLRPFIYFFKYSS